MLMYFSGCNRIGRIADIVTQNCIFNEFRARDAVGINKLSSGGEWLWWDPSGIHWKLVISSAENSFRFITTFLIV